MVNNISRKTWMTLSILAVISAIAFIVIQIFSGLEYDTDTTGQQRPISKDTAIQLATEFVNEQTGLIVSTAEAYHDSNKEYTGYIDKFKLMNEHKEKLDKFLPVDQYRVNVQFTNRDQGSVYLNLYSGDIIGWNFALEGTEVDQATAYQSIESMANQLGFPLNDRTNIDTYEKFSDHNQVDLNQLQRLSSDRPLLKGYYLSNDHLNIGDTTFQYDVRVVAFGDRVIVSQLLPDPLLPADYEELVAREGLYANIWTYAVYFFLTFVFGVLAIIYAIIYRQYTSFKFGVWLTVIATIISAIINLGLIKSQLGLEGQMLSLSDPLTMTLLIIFIFISLLLGAVSYYFSFVAGDGLWRAQGFQLWPRFRDSHYGQHVWDAMKIGYLMAIIGLGLQNVIFTLLSLTIGTWSANDTSQSLLNFEFSPLFPLLAWFAAISEEVVFRYFGVGIFRRWFKNTWLAALIPTIAWAAGHTLYPLYPASTRVIELIIIGYLFTWVMVRFGFIAAMFMHASFNTILIAISMLFFGSKLDIASACFFLVLPLLIALCIKWLHKRKAKKDTLDINRPQYPPATPQQ